MYFLTQLLTLILSLPSFGIIHMLFSYNSTLSKGAAFSCHLGPTLTFENVHLVQHTSPTSPGYLIYHVYLLACISLSPTIHICIYKSCMTFICKSADMGYSSAISHTVVNILQYKISYSFIALLNITNEISKVWGFFLFRRLAKLCGFFKTILRD